MKKVVQQFAILLCFLHISVLAIGQTVYTTPNPKTNPKVTATDVFKLKIKDVLAFPHDPDRGMIAMIKSCVICDPKDPTAEASLEIYAYDDTKADGKGAILYSNTLSTTATVFSEHSYLVTTTHYSDFAVFSTDIKLLTLDYVTHIANPLAFTSLSTFELPVIIEATTTKASIQRIRIPGIGDVTPEMLFKTSPGLDFAGLMKAPSRKAIINTFEDLGGIQINHYEWDPYNSLDHIDNWNSNDPIPTPQYLDGQGITMAKLDMSDPSKYKDYEIKFTYLFKDRDGNDIIPEKCITDDKPLGGQMDVLSHAVAREGGVFGINGTFYDYYYRCVPSIRQLIKIDNSYKAYPNVLSHKLQGAVGIDFTQTPPIKFQAVDVTSPAWEQLGDVGTPRVFQSLTDYKNVMSGGHFSTYNHTYDFKAEIPDNCKDGEVHPWPNIAAANGFASTKYPWEDELGVTWPSLKWMAKDPAHPDQKKGWAYLACERFDGGDYLHNYKNYFLCDNLDKTTTNYQEYRAMMTCIDTRRADDEFGGTGRQIRKARTFLAWKNNSLYMVAVDGLRLYRNQSTGAVEQYRQSSNQKNDDSQWGFTLDELGRFHQEMNFEYLLHLDGGTSTEFFINGKGMAQRPIESFATLDGPLRQRYTSSFIVIVPKFHLGQIDGLKFNRQHLKLDNSNMSEDDRSILEMTPSLPKINNANGTSGLFSTAFKIEDKITNEGTVLFSMSEAAIKSKNLLVAGIGKIPAGLVDSLKQFHGDANYAAALSKNEQASYAIIVNCGKVQQAWFDSSKSSSYYMNDKWHRFTLFQDGKSNGLSIDGESVEDRTGNTSDFFNLPAVTHMMMGGVAFGPEYYTSASTTEIDNVIFLTGDNVHRSIGKVTAIVGDQVPKGLDHLWNKPAGAYLLQMEEVEGMHAFAADESGKNKFFGLKLNTATQSKELPHAQLSAKEKQLK